VARDVEIRSSVVGVDIPLRRAAALSGRGAELELHCAFSGLAGNDGGALLWWEPDTGGTALMDAQLGKPGGGHSVLRAQAGASSRSGPRPQAEPITS